MSYNSSPPEIELVVGDVGDLRTVEVVGVTNLDWATSAVGELLDPATETWTDLDATITDPTNRLVEVDFDTDSWLAGATPGTYMLRVRCVSTTQTLTSPVRREDWIRVIVTS